MPYYKNHWVSESMLAHRNTMKKIGRSWFRRTLLPNTSYQFTSLPRAIQHLVEAFGADIKLGELKKKVDKGVDLKYKEWVTATPAEIKQYEKAQERLDKHIAGLIAKDKARKLAQQAAEKKRAIIAAKAAIKKYNLDPQTLIEALK